jgi:hypothetical protein
MTQFAPSISLDGRFVAVVDHDVGPPHLDVDDLVSNARTGYGSYQGAPFFVSSQVLIAPDYAQQGPPYAQSGIYTVIDASMKRLRPSLVSAIRSMSGPTKRSRVPPRV